MESFLNRLMMLILMLACLKTSVAPTSADDSYIVRLNGYKKAEVYSTSTSIVHYMEKDKYIPGNILFTDGYSLRTTNGSSVSTIAGSPTSSGYSTRSGTSGRFSSLHGIYQKNRTHVIVADYSYSCLRMIDRTNGYNSQFAGTCQSAGHRNGRVGYAYLYYPYQMLLDKTSPTTLIVSQNRASSSYAYLRSIDINTGYAGVLVSSGLNYPRGMMWDENENVLYVTNAYYVAKITWSTKSVQTLTGSTSSGNIVGSFSQSRFYSITEFFSMNKEIVVIIEDGQSKLKAINMASQVSMTVDISGFSSGIYSVAQINGSTYVGTSGTIYKLSELDSQCLVNASYLSGETEVKFGLNTKNCTSYLVNIIKSPVERRVSLKAEYPVSCDQLMLQGMFGKALLEPVLKLKMAELQDVCGNGCNMAVNVTPSYSCSNNTLEVRWPTDIVYTEDVKEIPTKTRNMLTKAAKNAGRKKAEILTLNRYPHFLLPRVQDNGESIQVVLESKCTEDGKVYQKTKDTCV